MWQPDAIWIERSELDSELARRVRARLPQVATTVIDELRSLPAMQFGEGKRNLLVQRHRGQFLQSCPAGTAGLVCCNYLVVNFGSNCPYDCSYCFLQEYIANNPVTKLFSNVGEGLSEIGAVLARNRERVYRIGTGELADSLALDWLTDLSCELVPFFAAHPNATLELKTKSACIENLLTLDHQERTVVSWSMSTPAIAAREELGTAGFDERIAAAKRVQGAGYRVGLHFDPLIVDDDWKEDYRDAVARIFSAIDARQVAWVSLGSLRISSRLKGAIRERHPRSRILTGELVPCTDGKERLWRARRIEIYRQMQEWLKQARADLPIYVCMEGSGVWQSVFGSAPKARQLGDSLVLPSLSAAASAATR